MSSSQELETGKLGSLDKDEESHDPGWSEGGLQPKTLLKAVSCENKSNCSGLAPAVLCNPFGQPVCFTALMEWASAVWAVFNASVPPEGQEEGQHIHEGRQKMHQCKSTVCPITFSLDTGHSNQITSAYITQLVYTRFLQATGCCHPDFMKQVHSCKHRVKHRCLWTCKAKKPCSCNLQSQIPRVELGYTILSCASVSQDTRNRPFDESVFWGETSLLL